MHLENRLSSAIFPNRGTAELAARELRRIGLSNIRLSEARDAVGPPTFAEFMRDVMARLGPGRMPSANDGAPLGKFERSLVEQGIPSETAAAVREQLRAGATLLTVRSGEQTERAMEIMRSFHATGSAPTESTQPPAVATRSEPAGSPLEAARSVSVEEAAELAPGADATMIERLQAMGGLTVRKVTVVERRQIEVELRREDLVIGRESGSDGHDLAGPSEIRIPLSHEEVTIGKRVVLAEWQPPDAGPGAASR